MKEITRKEVGGMGIDVRDVGRPVGDLTAQTAGRAGPEELTHELERLGGHTSQMQQIQADMAARDLGIPPRGLVAGPHQTPAPRPETTPVAGPAPCPWASGSARTAQEEHCP